MSGGNTGPVVGQRTLGGYLLSVLAWLVGVLFFFPVFWMAVSGFKTEADANADSTKFLPIVAAILPLWLIADYLGITNTRLLLIILYTAMNLPLAVWMLRSFFAEVPKELIEAAQIDGASLRSQITSVIMPIVAPGIAATALLCVIFAWNEFYLAVQLNTSGARTVTQWVSTAVEFQGQFLAQLSAAATLATLPVVIAGWLAQKRMIRGLAMGAIK